MDKPELLFQDRLGKVYNKLEELNLDGLLISNQSNISYLTGFPSRESYLLLSKEKNFFITDFRYIQEARQRINKGFLIKKLNGPFFNLIGKLCAGLHFKQLGFEARHLTFAEYEKIKERLISSTDLIPTYALIESFRQIKTEGELEKIKKAIQITMQAFKYVKKIIKPGMRELDLVSQIEHFIKDRGADSFSFDIIIASGVNSSFPHHITSKRRLKNNEPLLLDMGVSFQGYKSDLTRVFFLGKITPVFKRTYDIILRAQERAIKQIKPDVFISKVDDIARRYITQKGYGHFFGHNLGHGIGLEVHEEPHISSKNNNRLAKGMVFTVEPAIYFPGKFGIRLEDMVMVTQKGAEVLSGNFNKSN